MLAAATRIEQLALSQTESKQLAAALTEVQKHYPYAIDPKTQAWIQLIIAGSIIYGPRAYVVRQRLRGVKPVEQQPPEPPQQPGHAPAPPPRKDDLKKANGIERPKHVAADQPLTPSEIFGVINPSDPPKL